MTGETPPRDPARVVAAAYLLAVISTLVPLAVVGAIFAGVVLIRRNRPREGAGVIVLGLLCAGLGVTVLR
jgi:hypothetical protein